VITSLKKYRREEEMLVEVVGFESFGSKTEEVVEEKEDNAADAAQSSQET
jgi:hypothetical protein